MAQEKYPFEEYTKVYLVTTITDIAAPQASELDAGTDITCHLTKDGLQPGGDTAAVDAAALCTRVDSKVAGSVTYDGMLRLFRYWDEDDAWDLIDWGTNTHLVVRRGIEHSVAWTAGQPVEVYKIQTGEPVPANSATNTLQTFEVKMFVDQAELKATVAAGS